jgi:hypothetical protein
LTATLSAYLARKKLKPAREQLMETNQPPTQQPNQQQRKPGFSTTLVVIIIHGFSRARKQRQPSKPS